MLYKTIVLTAHIWTTYHSKSGYKEKHLNNKNNYQHERQISVSCTLDLFPASPWGKNEERSK